MRNHRLRFLIGKLGLDGHDRGALVVAKHIKNLGHEVIYAGLFNTPNNLVKVAFQEDVNAVGVSIMAGSPILLVKDLLQAFELSKLDPPHIFVGGVINEEESRELQQLGVSGIFPTGTQLSEITRWINSTMLK